MAASCAARARARPSCGAAHIERDLGLLGLDACAALCRLIQPCLERLEVAAQFGVLAMHALDARLGGVALLLGRAHLGAQRTDVLFQPPHPLIGRDRTAHAAP